MPNAIELAKTYVSMLDEVYKAAAVTSVLDGAPELVREGANANELIIPKISMDGLADYSRNSGYTNGDVTMTNETVACNFDRGRMFSVDTMDNIETAGLAFGRLAGEFIRTKVAPELDAFRFAAYAGKNGIGSASADLSTGADVVAALRAAVDAMDASEVPSTERHLFILGSLLSKVKDMDTTKSREVLDEFASVTKVPQSRFYTAIEQLNGTSTGETAGGYKKMTTHYQKCKSADTGALEVVADSTSSPTSIQIKQSAVTPVIGSYTPAVGDYVQAVAGKNINFMIVHKPAAIQFDKHAAPKIITPEMNQSGDGYKYGYRLVGIAELYDNKVAGVYEHHATT